MMTYKGIINHQYAYQVIAIEENPLDSAEINVYTFFIKIHFYYQILLYSLQDIEQKAL
jgi:hypothetical protein